MIASLNHRPYLCLAILLFANLMALSFQVRNDDGRSLAMASSLAIEAPAANALHFVRDSAAGALRRYVYLKDTEARNQALQLENQQLRLEMQRLRSLTAAARRTRHFDRLDGLGALETTAASVIQRNPPFFGRALVINAGSNHGVVGDLAVIVSEGVVGRVQTAGAWTSRVELIINPQAGVGAVLSGSRNLGVVRGNGDGSLRLDYIPHSVHVQVGDAVLTSGADGIYPKGLPVGRVASVERDSEIHQHIRLQPAVDFNRVEEVLIVRRQPQVNVGDSQSMAAGASLEREP